MKNYLYLIVLFSMISLGINPSRGENKVSEKKISVSELPQPAQHLLKTYFPGARVIHCIHSRTWGEYEVKIAGGYKLEFDKKGAWEEIDSRETPLSNRLVGLLPTAAIEYLDGHYPDAKIEAMEQRSNVYKLSLTRPEMKLYFTKSGEFVKQKKD